MLTAYLANGFPQGPPNAQRIVLLNSFAVAVALPLTRLFVRNKFSEIDLFQVTTVKKGGAVTLPGFGSFKQVSRAARTGVNPATGDKIKIAAAKLPKFSAGSAFKAAVDPKAAARKAANGAKPAGKKAAAKKR